MLKKSTIALLRRIQKAIKAEPRQFRIGYWFLNQTSAIEPIPNCHTAACIGGWAIALTHKLTPEKARLWSNKQKEENMEIAASALGITSKQAEKLFFYEQWPRAFGLKCRDDSDQAIARINHFIKTHGWE